MNLNLTGKRALVLASSQGIGLGIACELVREGAQVVLSSRNREHLENAHLKFGAAGYVVGDLQKPGDASKIVTEATHLLGGLDILITNTGGPKAASFEELSISDWKFGFQGVFLSVVEAIQSALGEFKKNNWGRIIMITSIAGTEAIPNLTISNALRAGLHGLTNSLSKEFGPYGVTVNAVLPGYTETERLAELGIPLEALAQKVPVRRLGNVSELGKFVTFLCSPEAGYFTGNAVAYDGGTLQGV
ncbi:MAG: SDR family oxidoreductase [Bdellovibrionales bacterium]|nr:SDR family oxidoreductase [Bdellovibrionales bacterium]